MEARCFNPRSRTGSDLYRRAQRLRFYSFNPRSRTGSDARGLGDARLAVEFQSTLPHGERPKPNVGESTLDVVSIHAPARGATRRAMSAASKLVVFQSTLPHGERLNDARQDLDRVRFNPRSRTGSDTAPMR